MARLAPENPGTRARALRMGILQTSIQTFALLPRSAALNAGDDLAGDGRTMPPAAQSLIGEHDARFQAEVGYHQQIEFR